MPEVRVLLELLPGSLRGGERMMGATEHARICGAGSPGDTTSMCERAPGHIGNHQQGRAEVVCSWTNSVDPTYEYARQARRLFIRALATWGGVDFAHTARMSTAAEARDLALDLRASAAMLPAVAEALERLALSLDQREADERMPIGVVVVRDPAAGAERAKERGE